MEFEGHSLGVLEFQKEELVERHMYSGRNKDSLLWEKCPYGIGMGQRAGVC